MAPLGTPGAGPGMGTHQEVAITGPSSARMSVAKWEAGQRERQRPVLTATLLLGNLSPPGASGLMREREVSDPFVNMQARGPGPNAEGRDSHLVSCPKSSKPPGFRFSSLAAPVDPQLLDMGHRACAAPANMGAQPRCREDTERNHLGSE